MKLKATLLFIIAMRIAMIMSVEMLHAAHKRMHLQEKLHEKAAKVKVARFHITSLNLLHAVRTSFTGYNFRLAELTFF